MAKAAREAKRIPGIKKSAKKEATTVGPGETTGSRIAEALEKRGPSAKSINQLTPTLTLESGT